MSPQLSHTRVLLQIFAPDTNEPEKKKRVAEDKVQVAWNYKKNNWPG